MLHAPRSTLLAPSSLRAVGSTKSEAKLLASLVLAVSVLFSAAASGQSAILEKTTLGSSQNDSRDLVNSLIVPNRTKFGKEKKEEVDLKTLQTKSAKDTTFQGNLMDIDLDWGGSKLGKPPSTGDKNSKTADAAGAKDSKVSQQADAPGKKESKASKSAPGGDDQNKDQKAKAAASAEKTSDKEKASEAKPDGDR
jgi:hypothetical protein